MNDACGICLEDSNEDNWLTLECGHRIHKKCHSKLVLNKFYKCPLCLKTINTGDCLAIWVHLRKSIDKHPNKPKHTHENETYWTPNGFVRVVRYIKNVDLVIGVMQGSMTYTNTDDFEMSHGIYCNDCNTHSLTKYNKHGNECMLCHSFNTRMC